MGMLVPNSLVMEKFRGAYVEGGYLERLELGLDDAMLTIFVDNTVLGHYLGDEVTFNDDLQLSRPRVNVEGVEALFA
jgi:hypothetical protein